MPLGRIDQFSVIRLLGRGGVGDVYLARDLRLDCDVALKVLREDRAGEPTQRARLLAEARSLAKVDHPNVVGILGCGEARPDPPDFLWPGSDGLHPASVVYLAMRHVEGTDLRVRIHEDPIPLRQAIEWARQILSGLEAAHVHGVVHRDLKPGNIRITRTGELKLLDFGLASTHHSSSASSGSTQSADHDYILGTVGYTSPEQCNEAGHSDPRCDLFSTGVILYEMVTRRRPFQGSTFIEVLSAIAKEDAPPLRRFADGVPPELERITVKLLQKDPGHRYQSAHEALTDLEALQVSMSTTTRLPLEVLRERAERLLPTRALRVRALVMATTLVLLAIVWPRPRGTQTVVVTAIENLTGSPQMDLVAVGLTQDLLSTLAQGCRVNIVESRLLDAKRVPNRDPRELGREYGASSVLLSTFHLKQGDDGASSLSLHIREVRVSDQVTRWAREWEVGPQGVAELRRHLLQTALAHWPQAQGVAAGTRGALAVRPPAADEGYLRGLGYLASGDPVVRDSSLAEFDQALLLDPAFARAYAGRARGQLAGFLFDRDTTRLALAEADARRATELAPGESEGHLALAQIVQHRGRTLEAVAELRGVVARNEHNAETYKLLGEAYAKLGDMKNARRSYRSALELQPSGPRVWRSYGNFLLAKAADLAGAEHAFRREIELSPQDNKGYEDLAAALIQQCRYAEAVASYADRPDPRATSMALHSNRGVALFFSGDHAGALRDFLEAVKAQPENGRQRLNLGDAYLQLGRREEALREYHDARSLLGRELVAQPDDVHLRAQFAMSIAKTGDFGRALAEIERCEASHSERHADALHSLAKALALCGERDRALRALKILTRAGYSKCLLRAETEFVTLRDDSKFRALMAGSVD